MISEKDHELVQKLYDSTLAGNIGWQATATTDQYSASFKAKWTALVDQYDEDNNVWWTLRIMDLDGRELLRITDSDDQLVRNLYDAARRSALKVDDAVKDIIDELDNDIPF